MKLHSRTQLFAQVSIPPQHRRSRCFLARRPSCAGASSNTSNILAQQHQRSTVASQHSCAMAPHRAQQQLPQELTPSRRFRPPERFPRSAIAPPSFVAIHRCDSRFARPKTVHIALAREHRHRCRLASAQHHYCNCITVRLRALIITSRLARSAKTHGRASSRAIATMLPRQVACCARVRLFLRPSQPALQQLTHHLTLLQPPISFFSPQPCFVA